MTTKSHQNIYGASVRAAAERAREARREADKLACDAWNKRMLAFKGPAQPSPTLGDALNADYTYLEVRCLGCDTHQTVALDIVRRPKTTTDWAGPRDAVCLMYVKAPAHPRRSLSTGHSPLRGPNTAPPTPAPSPRAGPCLRRLDVGKDRPEFLSSGYV